ncbi:glycine betaine ABC transporter substrate-binding protein [Swingsia samuiensis]|uniref:ABC-type glycine betaine transport system substrate-binding domain-containing protein n=1 Tax=Swingsia samuiensis TaxID=1293412 RepID=A0A4Y6UMW9_9PROT|nr:glycine betaine ABC transporter substrate-binding protein [Swingsia samuiensis]QDH17697.1 hypothetical protein E3D00_09060 [Swingsia samuiensis]
MTQMTIGHLYTSLHAGCASAVARVLEAHEVDVEFVDLDEEDVIDSIKQKEVDVLVSAWFPRDDKLSQLNTRVIGDLYQPQVVFAGLSDLPPVKEITEKNVERIIVTDDSHDVLQEALKKLPLLAELPLEVVGEAALIDRLRDAQESNEKVLVVVTQPHAVFHTSLLTPVADPDFLLGKEMSARIVIREEVARHADSDLLDELSEMMLGNKVMSALDYIIGVEGQDPDDAAEAWQRGRLIPRDA